MLEKSFAAKFDLQKYVILLLNLKRCIECYSPISKNFIINFLDRKFSNKTNTIFNIYHKNKKCPVKFKSAYLSRISPIETDRITISENCQLYCARVLLVQYFCSKCPNSGFVEIDIDCLNGNNFLR